jgi:hypothetical protein
MDLRVGRPRFSVIYGYLNANPSSDVEFFLRIATLARQDWGPKETGHPLVNRS